MFDTTPDVNMLIGASSHDQRKNGPRPINLNKDIPQVLKLLELVFGASLDREARQMFAGTKSLGEQPSFLWRLSPAASKLAQGFVWEYNGRVVGNVTVLNTNTPGRYLVVNVAVHPDFRRQGIARRLMAQVDEMVRAREGRQILLQVVKSNTAAIGLYNSLNYETIGSMANWYAPVSRLRQLELTGSDFAPAIRELKKNEWQAAYRLDQQSLHRDLNWPELLSPDAYKSTLWVKIANFLNGRHTETWITAHNKRLTGLVSIVGELGRTHTVSLRVHPRWRGQLERPLLAKMIRRLQYLPRRNVQIDHPDDDEITSQLLREANFQPRRTLTHMRLDID